MKPSKFLKAPFCVDQRRKHRVLRIQSLNSPITGLAVGTMLALSPVGGLAPVAIVASREPASGGFNHRFADRITVAAANSKDNQSYRGSGTIDNARFRGAGSGTLIINPQRNSGSLFLMGTRGGFSVEYIGRLTQVFEGSVQIQVTQFRSSEMGYRTVTVAGTCDLLTSGGTSLVRAFCTVSGAGVDHGRTSFTAIAPSPSPVPPPTTDIPNQVYRGEGQIDNARFQGVGNATSVLNASRNDASLVLNATGGRFSVEYLGRLQQVFEGNVQFQVTQFRSSEMGYRTVPATGTCELTTSAGVNLVRAVCSVSGAGIDHGRSAFTANR